MKKTYIVSLITLLLFLFIAPTQAQQDIEKKYAEPQREKAKAPNELFLVRLSSVGKNEINVIKVIRNLTKLNLKEAKEIVDRLGVVAENISQKETKIIRKTLEAVGAKVRIEEMPSSVPQSADEPQKIEKKYSEPQREKAKVPNELFLVRLLSGGEHEINVVKMVHELTKLGLKESKGVVDRLGVVAENLSKKEAESIKKMLEAVGASLRIEEMPSSEPQSADEPQPDIDDSKTIYGNLTDKNGQSLAKFTIAISDSTIEKWLSLVKASKEKEE